MLTRYRNAFALAAFIVLAVDATAQTTYQWSATASGNWSAGTNWIGGVAPPNGGGIGVGLTFNATGSTGYTATNDLGSFTVNQITFASSSSQLITLVNAATSSFSIGGTGASLVLSGPGSGNLNGNSALQSTLTVSGNGAGTTILSGNISGTGAITFNRSSPYGVVDTLQCGFERSSLEQASANSFSGGVNLVSGNLVFNEQRFGYNAAFLGTGTFSISGGTIRNVGNAVSISNPVVLSSDLVMVSGNATGTTNFSGSLSAAATAGVKLLGYAQLGINSNWNYSGATSIATGMARDSNAASLQAGQLTLSNAGAITSTSSILIGAGGTLQVNNATAAGNRINDTAQVTIIGGEISMSGSATNWTEAIGTTAYSSNSTIAVSSVGTLTVSNLTRTDRGTLTVSGTSLGQSSSTNRILTGNSLSGDLVGGGGGAGTTTISILPYAFASDSQSFLTVGANGLRPLTTGVGVGTEYKNGLIGAAPFDNVAVISSTPNFNSSITINSLFVAASSFNAIGITGTGSLTISSGAICVLSSINDSGIDLGLNFGSREAVITNQSTLQLNGTLSGSNGFTKSGAGTLKVTADSPGLIGTLTINQGMISVSDLAYLPGSGAIRINGISTTTSSSGIQYTGTTLGTLTRDIALTGVGTISTSNLAISSSITGSGSLVFGYNGTFYPTITLNGITQNTYSGGTIVALGGLNGNLLVNMVQGTGTGDVVVRSGVLGGTGTIYGSVVIRNSISTPAAVSPGDPSVNSGISSFHWTGSAAIHQFDGGQYIWQVNSSPSAGVAGSQWDFIQADGRLLVTANSASQFTVSIQKLSSYTFDPGQNYTWKIATFAGGIDAVPDNAFQVNISGFSNSILTSQFSVTTDSNSIYINYVAPVPEPASLLLLLAGTSCAFYIRRRRVR